jgi:translation initiation factor IF-3
MNQRLAVNAEIRAKEVRLIGPEGKQVGIVPLKIAIDAAKELDLDLVEVAPQANPPVAKVMDYGKHLYEQERAEREARKQQRSSGQKAIRLRPKIDDHDFATKERQARKFLEGGHSVRVQVMFRRREMRRPELGTQLLDRLAGALADVAHVEARSDMEGRFASMVLAPKGGGGTSGAGARSAES